MHWRIIVIVFIMVSICFGCRDNSISTFTEDADNEKIECTEGGCMGVYIGPEFVLGDDIAHQFSNSMSTKVGEKLKELYNAGKYSKVDFEEITMTTKGMGSGFVKYELFIPFIRVGEPCDAYTSFDHSGGWNHAPDIAGRKVQLSTALLKGESLEISDLKETPEGLQEYWIQWKNKIVQANCSPN